MRALLCCFLSILLLSATLAGGQQPDPDQLFTSAVDAQQHGDYAKAIRDYQKLLQLRPEMGDARANLGAALAHVGRLDEAIAEYKLALNKAPDRNAVLMNLGLAYYKKGDWANASRQFQEVQKARPQDVQLAILLGDSDVHLGHGAEALAALTPLQADNAGNPDFAYVLGTAMIAAGSRREGASQLDQVAAATNGADAYFIAGSTWMDVNEYEKARADLEAALRLNPNLPRINTLTGMARDRTGDQKAAEPAFRAALQLDPNDFEANLYLGAILYKRRALEESKPYLDKALLLQPTNPTALYEAAMWKSTAGQYAEAAKQLEAIVGTEPNWLDPHIQLATVYYKLHRPEDGAKERAIVAKLTAEQQSKGPGK